MTQQWLTVLGLALDFTGFMLLLREWWLAFFNEERQIAVGGAARPHAGRCATSAPARRASATPTRRWSGVQDEQAIRRARAEHGAALTARRGTFLVATVLIVVGFVLQIIGAWPGCCPPWITPQN